MATQTYTYNGVTNPAPDAGHKARKYEAATANPSAPETGTEAINSEYTSLATQDGSDFVSNAGTGGNYAFEEFRIYAPIAGTVTQIDLKVRGWGNFGGVQHGFQAFQRKASAGTWESMGTHSNSSDTDVTSSIAVNPENYIDANSYIYLAAKATWATGAQSSQCNVDYVEVIITYTPSAPPSGQYTPPLKVWAGGWGEGIGNYA